MITAVSILGNDNLYQAQYRFTESGDTLVVVPTTPTLGISGVSAYSIAETHTGNDTFEIGFRYSLDGGLNWSGWSDIVRLEGLSVKPDHWFALEFSIKKVGSKGPSYFGGISLELDGGGFKEPDFYSRKVKTTSKPNYYNHNSIAWALNVLQKIYKKGIVPSFIHRSDNKAWKDEGYINFWWSLIYPVALRISFAEIFTDLLWSPELLKKFLEQRGLILGNNPTLGELYYLMTHFYDEVSKRGTMSALSTIELGEDSSLRGEFGRLIGQKSSEDLKTFIINSWSSGWWLGQTSLCGYCGNDMVFDFLVGNDIAKSCPISPIWSYLVKVEISNQSDLNSLNFSVKGKDSVGGQINFINANGEPDNEFFNGSLPKGEHCLLGVIRTNGSDYVGSVDGLCQVLEFSSNENVSSVKVEITGSGSFEVQSFGIYLLDDTATYLESYIGKILKIYLKNNNLNYTDKEVGEILEEKFVPIGMNCDVNFIK